MTPIDYGTINQYVDYLQQIPIEILAERLAAHGICINDIMAAWPTVYQQPWWYNFIPFVMIATFTMALIATINILFTERRWDFIRRRGKKGVMVYGLKTESAEAQKEEGRPPDA